MTFPKILRALIFLSLAFGLPTPALADDDQSLWQGVKDGKSIVLLRHALAPGTGDPSNFELRDCSTQRNLSDTGREQSKRIGDLFKANGIAVANVLSSQWCRCLETAELMGLGSVQEFPTINSFFRNFAQRAPQTNDLRTWIAEADLTTPTVLVTHQVNITALTEVFPSSGELIFLERKSNGTLSVAGTIETD